MIITIILAVILLAISFGLIYIYNGFITKRNMVDEAFSGIDVILKKRFDLIPNLVETVKGYASHEKDTFESVINLRNQALNAKSSDEKMQIDKNLSQAITKIFALAESYPDLKANTNFLALQTDLTEIETEIERSKRYYNGTVREFNIGVESFPGNIIAGIFGFAKKSFLEIADITHRDSPKVQF